MNDLERAQKWVWCEADENEWTGEENIESLAAEFAAVREECVHAEQILCAAHASQVRSMQENIHERDERIRELEALCVAVWHDHTPTEIRRFTSSIVAVWEVGAVLKGRGKALEDE